MSMYKKSVPTRGFKFFSVVYFIIFVAIAFFLSSLVMNKWDVYDLLSLNTLTIPGINKPGSDIPEMAIQVALAGIIFFILQFVTVFVISIFKREEDEYERLYREQSQR